MILQIAIEHKCECAQQSVEATLRPDLFSVSGKPGHGCRFQLHVAENSLPPLSHSTPAFNFSIPSLQEAEAGGSLDSDFPSCVPGSTPAFYEQCQQQLLIPFLIFQGRENFPSRYLTLRTQSGGGFPSGKQLVLRSPTDPHGWYSSCLRLFQY